jgi:hypothetical protein
MKAVSFATLINEKVLIPSPRTHYIAIDKEHLIDILRPILRSIYLDTDWYLAMNPDIGEGIKSGLIASALDHYVSHGYYEHRMPYEIQVEEIWYISQYPDVQEAVTKGLFSSARDHYYSVGYREGRVPHANFTLRTVNDRV